MLARQPRPHTPARHHGPRPGRAGRALAAPQAAAPAPAAIAAPLDVWTQFCGQVSGEYEGATASFALDGTPFPLDPHYVPQAFRDWGVELHDWQTTCSTLAKPEEPGLLGTTCRCMMPTVGCEADAVAFTEEAQAAQGSLRAVAPDGSYVAGPLHLDEADGRARIEFCVPFTDPSAPPPAALGGVGVQAPRERLRIVHRLQVNWQTNAWGVARVELHREKYDAPYHGRVDLCGCGGGMPAFSKLEPATEEQAARAEVWKPDGLWAYDIDAQGSAQLIQPPVASLPPAEGARTLLPLGVTLHSAVGPAGDVHLRAVVAAGPGLSRVAVCSFAGGRVHRAAVGALVPP